MRLVAGRMLIDGSAVDTLAPGAELLAIDGRDVSHIVAELLPYLRADGDADGKRLAQIDHGENGGAMDRLFPLLHPPREGAYQLQLRAADGVRLLTVSATTMKARATRLAERGVVEPSDDWSFAIHGRLAVLTLPTFSFWNGKFKWAAYLEDVFAQMRRRKVAKLIIDIRRNEGGDDAIGSLLLSHLLHQPYSRAAGRAESAFERVPYKLARFLDTWDFSFFDRTAQVLKSDGRNWIFREQPKTETLLPALRPFAGKVRVLIGPNNSSAGFLVARDIKAAQVALLVGLPTAGSQRGLNGGQLAWITLPASGVAVDIPLFAAVHDELPDTGVQPDVLVTPSFKDAQAGIDTEMRVALEASSR
jgi:C-terminal processing protease CtpA/Prc